MEAGWLTWPSPTRNTSVSWQACQLSTHGMVLLNCAEQYLGFTSEDTKALQDPAVSSESRINLLGIPVLLLCYNR